MNSDTHIAYAAHRPAPQYATTSSSGEGCLTALPVSRRAAHPNDGNLPRHFPLNLGLRTPIASVTAGALSFACPPLASSQAVVRPASIDDDDETPRCHIFPAIARSRTQKSCCRPGFPNGAQQKAARRHQLRRHYQFEIDYGDCFYNPSYSEHVLDGKPWQSQGAASDKRPFTSVFVIWPPSTCCGNPNMP